MKDGDSEVKDKTEKKVKTTANLLVKTADVVKNSSVSLAETETLCTLLSTAVIYVKDVRGKWRTCRALLDSGVHSNFISQELFNKLKLLNIKKSMQVKCVEQMKSNSRKAARVHFTSWDNKYDAEADFFVLSSITDQLPQQ